MSGAINRLRNRKMSAAFEGWQANAAEMKRQTEALDRALRKMRNSKMAAAFTTWRDFAREQRDTQYKMKGALTRMLQRKLSVRVAQLRAKELETNRRTGEERKTITP